jgi:hypothetical protein
MEKYLSIALAIALLYFIVQDVKVFWLNSELVLLTLSHFSLTIWLRELFHDQFSLVYYFVIDLAIMFIKTFFLEVLVYNNHF